MSKIVVSSMVSVDGYTEGPGGDVMAMPMDLAFADHNAERAREAQSFLFGATTYRGAITYWPPPARGSGHAGESLLHRPAVRRRHPDNRSLR